MKNKTRLNILFILFLWVTLSFPNVACTSLNKPNDRAEKRQSNNPGSSTNSSSNGLTDGEDAKREDSKREDIEGKNVEGDNTEVEYTKVELEKNTNKTLMLEQKNRDLERRVTDLEKQVKVSKDASNKPIFNFYQDMYASGLVVLSVLTFLLAFFFIGTWSGRRAAKRALEKAGFW